MLELIRQIWQVFSQQFAELARQQSVLGEWQSERYIQRYLDELLQDTLAFAGVELIRRTIGLAHAPEWELMAEEPALIPAAQQSLGMARHWLLPTQPWSNMDSALQIGREA